MRPVIFVLPDEMADCGTAVVYSYTLDQTTRCLIEQAILIPNPTCIYIEKKNIRFVTRITNLLQSYELRGKQLFVSHFSRFLRHALEKG